MLAALTPSLVQRQGRSIQPHTRIAIALKQALNDDIEIGPDRLGAGIAAPEPAKQGRHQEQGQGCGDEQAGEIINLLRPQLDKEKEKPGLSKINQNRLIGHARPPVPAQPGQDRIDR